MMMDRQKNAGPIVSISKCEADEGSLCLSV